ncbi:MAG: secondary thiamine-phosphate synthase enzyme YjbQ [Candidatus Rifleibacteriota bacterium]
MIFEHSVRTPSSQAFVDVTGLVRSSVRQAGIKEGHILVATPHTTAAVTVNENADPDVVHDLLKRFNKVFPEHESFDRHGEGNSHAHMKSSLFGACHPFIVHDGDLLLGTWQGIYLCEFDGPRTRRLIVSVLARQE